ncbi:efflux RND transporter periplasmic adaptor subunit [Synechococcus sp. CBW1107]|uniref:efflux RND transporter periplasmic adaptor subunit n=2 Tax=unclassified Synechococcus TaxID=2626047 RepID=UPI002AD1EC54|nr:efflux RND transporter periplasmic adaptor subunit [Synechococcus sp. CBW1107]CAK6693508.1 Multidrug resistance protein MdtA [Synechococcus sp. CBW1107]
MRLPLIALLAVGLAGGGWLLWQQNRRSQEERALAAQTAAVQQRAIAIRVTAAGSIRPITPVNISPKQPGRVSQLLVDQGDRVVAGQLLARMDDSNLRGPLLQAQGNLATSEANLRRLLAGNRPLEIEEGRRNLQEATAQLIAVRSTYRSNQELYGSGAVARVAFDSSRSQFLASEARVNALQAQLDLLKAGPRREDIDSGRAQVQQARGALATIQAQVNDTSIRAPFSGVITQKYADVGAFVTPTTSASATTSATSSSILALASALEGMANVAEVDVGSIFKGQPVELQLDAYPGQTFRGTVRLVSPEAVVEQNVTSFQVRIALAPQDAKKLRSGMNLTAQFLVARRPEALLVPTPAIVSQEGGMGVYVVGPDRKPRFQSVRVGATVGSLTEVLGGVGAGDRVFLSTPGRRSPNNRPVSAASPLGQPAGRGGGPRLPR